MLTNEQRAHDLAMLQMQHHAMQILMVNSVRGREELNYAELYAKIYPRVLQSINQQFPQVEN